MRCAAEAEARAVVDAAADARRGEPPKPHRSFRVPQEGVPDLLMVWDFTQVGWKEGKPALLSSVGLLRNECRGTAMHAAHVRLAAQRPPAGHILVHLISGPVFPACPADVCRPASAAALFDCGAGGGGEPRAQRAWHAHPRLHVRRQGGYCRAR